MQSVTTPPSLWSALPATKLPVPANKLESIRVSHINIRMSISFLIMKLVLIEILGLIFIISTNALYNLPFMHTVVLTVFLIIKSCLSLIVIFQWLNEYYEITPSMLIHRRGILFKKEEEYVFSHLMSIDFKQSLWGKIFNYGSIHLYDRYINRDIYIYLIHNPTRYFNILKELIPYTDSMQEKIREQIIEEENNGNMNH